MWPVIGGPLLVAAGALLGARGAAHRRHACWRSPARPTSPRSARARWCPAPTTTSAAWPALAGLALRLARASRSPACACCWSRRAARSRSWRACRPSRGSISRIYPTDRTHVICVDTVGSPELVMLEGEGMLRMHDYPAAFREAVARVRAPRAACTCAAGLRFRNATDARSRAALAIRRSCSARSTATSCPTTITGPPTCPTTSTSRRRGRGRLCHESAPLAVEWPAVLRRPPARRVTSYCSRAEALAAAAEARSRPTRWL